MTISNLDSSLGLVYDIIAAGLISIRLGESELIGSFHGQRLLNGAFTSPESFGIDLLRHNVQPGDIVIVMQKGYGM